MLSRTYLPTRQTRAIYYFEIVNSKRSNGNCFAFAFHVIQYHSIRIVYNEMYFIRKLYGNIEFVRFMRVFFLRTKSGQRLHHISFQLQRFGGAQCIGISIMYEYTTRRVKTMDAQTIYCTVCCGMNSRYTPIIVRI